MSSSRSRPRPQLPRGAALTILAAGPQRGYQLAIELEKQSNGQISLKLSTLHKLEKDGLIDSAWDEELEVPGEIRYDTEVVTGSGTGGASCWPGLRREGRLSTAREKLPAG